MLKIILLILFSATLVSIGQVFFKKGVTPIPTPDLSDARSYGRFLAAVFKAPVIWLGFATIGVGIVLWLIALAQTDLSVAFPIDSMQYLVIIVAARIFLGEKIDRMKMMGTLLVVGGILLIAMS